MPRRKTIASLAAACAIGSFAPSTAMAAGAVVGQQGETATISRTRIAVATTAGRSTWWTQVSVEGVNAGFVWLLPVRPGALVNLGSDAWLDALDATTAPVVLPPTTETFCDAGSSPELIAPTTSPRSIDPAQTVLVTDLASLEAFVSGAGYALPPELGMSFASLFASSPSAAVVASRYTSSALPTRTVRVVDGGPAILPFALSGSAASTVQVTAFAIASASATAGSAPLALDPSTVLWESDGTSTYAQALGALLRQWQGTRWVTESSMPDLFFDGAPIVAGASLPSAFAQYFTLASAYGDATGDPLACAAAAYATRTDPASYVATCPDGSLAVAPGPSPCAAVDDGGESDGVPVAPLLCGGSANDAALAVAGLTARNLWVTRVDGLVTAGSASDVPVSTSAASLSSPVVTAGGYALTCASPPSTAGAPPPSAPASSAPAEPGGQSSPSTSQASDAAPAVADGCGSALGDACSSSDSSSDDEDDSGGCGSSDKSDDDDSSGGCGSSDSSSSNSSCTTGARVHRRGRSPVSRAVLVLVATAALFRRRAPRRDARTATGRGSSASGLTLTSIRPTHPPPRRGAH